MDRYRIIKKKTFESIEKFEERINRECQSGWRVVNLCCDTSTMYALMERERKS